MLDMYRIRTLYVLDTYSIRSRYDVDTFSIPTRCNRNGRFWRLTRPKSDYFHPGAPEMKANFISDRSLWVLDGFSMPSLCLHGLFTGCSRNPRRQCEESESNPRATLEPKEKASRRQCGGKESGVWSSVSFGKPTATKGVRETSPDVSIKTHSGISILLFVNERVQRISKRKCLLVRTKLFNCV
jgi:hypothetical protein